MLHAWQNRPPCFETLPPMISWHDANLQATSNHFKGVWRCKQKFKILFTCFAFGALDLQSRRLQTFLSALSRDSGQTLFTYTFVVYNLPDWSKKHLRISFSVCEWVDSWLPWPAENRRKGDKGFRQRTKKKVKEETWNNSSPWVISSTFKSSDVKHYEMLGIRATYFWPTYQDTGWPWETTKRNSSIASLFHTHTHTHTHTRTHTHTHTHATHTHTHTRTLFILCQCMCTETALGLGCNFFGIFDNCGAFFERFDTQHQFLSLANCHSQSPVFSRFFVMKHVDCDLCRFIADRLSFLLQRW